jgi:hypothetical protein
VIVFSFMIEVEVGSTHLMWCAISGMIDLTVGVFFPFVAEAIRSIIRL